MQFGRRLLRQQVRGGDSLNYIRTVLLPYATVSYTHLDYEVTGKSQEDVINELLMERRRELWGEGFGITDILRTQQAVERAALSDEMQKTEVDCWQEGGSFEKRNPLGHCFLNFPNGKPFTVNSTYYLYAIPQKEINACLLYTSRCV